MINASHAKCHTGVPAGSFEHPIHLQLDAQVLHAAIALDAIAVAAEQLQIAQMIRAALGAWHYMVDFQVARLEVCAAAFAVAGLLAV